MAHVALEESEARKEQRARDASNTLYLAVLLQGKKEGREKVWKHLAALASGDETPQDGKDLADMRAYEKANFTRFNEYWLGAMPDVTHHSNGHSPSPIGAEGRED